MGPIDEMKVGSKVKCHARGVVSAVSSDPAKLTVTLAAGYAMLTATSVGVAWILLVFDDGATDVHQTAIVI